MTSRRLEFFLLLLLAFFARFSSAADPPLNVVLILADDLGWTDLSCYGSDFYETPHLDQLARDGMRFTQAYSACTVCSPTRASILTGKYPARLHITDWIPGLLPTNPKMLPPEWTKFLPREEACLAELFHQAGYKTGSIGKWHLGNEEFYPQQHGFDVNIAGTHAPSPPSYFAPYRIATLPEGPDGEYLTDRLANEAVTFIERNKDQPFFLYLPHFAVHLPIQGKKDVADKYRSKMRAGLTHTNAMYAAMLESLDQAVGRVRQKLAELQLTERTVVIFTSDNGGHLPTTSNGPLRYGKASCYEGGTRVPLIISWPHAIRGGTECATPVISPDLYPTVLEIASLKGAAGHRPDGVSLVPLLRQSGELNREDLYWHYPHYQLYQQGGTTPYGAIRSGDWKLIEFFDDQRIELYNLKDDIGEQKNLAQENVEKASELRTRLHQWRQDVGAQMPTKNPAYDPSKPEHTAKAKKKG
jgi:arylsulfatase A